MAKILQVANSASIGSPVKIHDPGLAVQQLGLDTVRSLALSAHVFENFTPSRMKNFSVDALWSHLTKCANSARAIMQAEDADAADMEAAFTAGMLHDIGKLMLAHSLPAEFQSALSLAATNNVPLHEAERDVFGTTHAELAAYLLGLWGLPATMVEAVAFHHAPERSAHQQFSPLTAVYVANALEHEAAGEKSCLKHEYLAKIGMENRLDSWRKIIPAPQDS
jgi:putative nucleotidyltransferase with HDIG domain